MDSRQLRPQRTPQSQRSRSRSQPSTPSVPPAAWGRPDTESNPQEEMQTQDWVSEPPERRRSGRRWSISIDERRRLAALRGQPRRDSSGTPSPRPDITQMVAELVSEDVDRDVLLPRPLRSAASTNAFQDFLARSTPFWQSSTFEAQTSRSPPS
uniref:testis-expressed protein 22 n=1 Tax=Jaculus jaculus TaxID=51337 RepID=UPI000332FC97|nr:testis-expressed protein 22 [Jaculus jaculus]